MRILLAGVVLLGLQGCGNLTSSQNNEQQSSTSNKETPEDKQGKKSIIGRKTREILNAADATKDNQFKIVEVEVDASDPLSAALQTYEKQAPVVGTFGIKQWINHQKILNDRVPTYEELQNMMEKNPGITLPVMPYKRKYGYDEKTGEIVILEPTAAKS